MLFFISKLVKKVVNLIKNVFFLNYNRHARYYLVNNNSKS